MDLPPEILNLFSWQEISIQKDNSGNCFLILATTEEKSKLMYEIISMSRLKIEINIDPVSKIYSLSLVFRYNQSKEIVYSYDTGLTSEIYPPLIWLTNGTVNFITTGVQSENNLNHFSYKKPLLHLDVMYHPN